MCVRQRMRVKEEKRMRVRVRVRVKEGKSRRQLRDTTRRVNESMVI